MGTAEILFRISEQIKRRNPFKNPYRNVAITLDLSKHNALLGCGRAVYNLSKAQESIITLEESALGHCRVIPPVDGKWYVDPLTGYDWECSKSYRVAGQDPKYVWERNRLLPLLQLVYQESDNNKIGEIIDSWLEYCPVRNDINWVSCIEVAIRAICLTTAAPSYLKLRPENATKLEQYMKHSYAYLRRFPSKYSSANNHRVAELVGLIIIGEIWKGLATDSDINKYWVELNEVMKNLFTEDGWCREESITYGLFSIELVSIALALSDLELTAHSELKNTVELGINIASLLVLEDGNLLTYGDNDEGRIFASMVGKSQWYIAVCAIAGYKPHDETGLFCYEHSGHTVYRMGSRKHRMIVHFDHGSLGFGSLSAHGHNDQLHFSLAYGGKIWIADAGTYRYNGDSESRRLFRSAAVHNGPHCLGMEPNIINTDFSFDPKNRAICDTHINEEEAVEARLEIPLAQIVITRRMSFLSETNVVVKDHIVSKHRNDSATKTTKKDVTGSSSVNGFETTFLIPQGFQVTAENNSSVNITAHDLSAELVLTWSGEISLAIHPASSNDYFISENYGEKQPATALVFSLLEGMETEFNFELISL